VDCTRGVLKPQRFPLDVEVMIDKFYDRNGDGNVRDEIPESADPAGPTT